MEVYTLENLTREALDLETKPHAVQRQVIELKNELLNYESLKPPPFPVPRMHTTKHTSTTPTSASASTQPEIFWRNWTVPEKRPPNTDIRGFRSNKSGLLLNHPTAKPFRQQTLSMHLELPQDFFMSQS